MTVRVWRHPQAKRDIIEQAEFIARDNPDASKRFVAATEATFLQLSRMSHMGTLFETGSNHLQHLRHFPVSGFAQHLIFYASHEDHIEIVRVLHVKRDLEVVVEGE
jgi:toxin ParE1/3/4